MRTLPQNRIHINYTSFDQNVNKTIKLSANTHNSLNIMRTNYLSYLKTLA